MGQNQTRASKAQLAVRTFENLESSIMSAPAKTTEPAIHPLGRLAGRFYEDKRLIILTVLLAVASGVSSLFVLPRMEDPLLTQRACTITTIYPGADAERVEALITEKIEDELIDIPELKRMRSTSSAGASFISIELRDDVYDTEPVWSAIRGKLEDSISNLPTGTQRPIFDQPDIAAYAWIGALVWEHEQPVSTGVLRRLARELKDQLIAIKGTKSIDFFGDPGEEIVVEIDADKAATAGLTVGQIARQISSADVKSSAGVLRGDRSETVVEIGNQFDSLSDILQATVATSGAGQSLPLSNLATVSRTAPNPVPSKAIVDGKTSVVVAVMLRPEYRIDLWTDEADKVIADFESQLPRGIVLENIMHQEVYVSQRMSGLTNNLLLGVSAVAIVTLIFMGWRSSLLVTATLPVAALMVIGWMNFLEIPIHQMSITGLIIALGLLIDNAIIAADEIDISLRRGLAPKTAVIDMVSRLFAPLLASTVTTALAFAPIALMEGPAGEFVGSIAITVMLAISSSFLLAMSVLPASAALLQGDQTKTSGNAKENFGSRLLRHGISVPWITAIYRRWLAIMLKYPVLGILAGCLLPICGFVASTQLKEQFFPPADRDQFYIEVELEPRASLAQTEQIVERINGVLGENERVKRLSWFLGESAPPFYYNIIRRRKNAPNYGQGIVTLADNRSSLELIRELQHELDSLCPEARVLVRQLEQGPPFDAPVELRVFGPSIEQLRDYGEKIRTMATQVPDVLHARTALSDSRPVANVQIDSQTANWAGMTEQFISEQLFASIQGINAGTILEEVEEIPVRVRLREGRVSSIQQLGSSNLLVSTRPTNALSQLPNMETVPVSALATVSLKPQRASITRYNGRRMNEVQSFITAGTLPSKVLSALQARIDESDLADLPAGYSIEIGGEAAERDAAVGRLLASVAVLLVGMVAALVLALASFRLAALIGLVATLSIGLGMGSLWIFGYPFGFMAIVGTMGLVGIAINDSIVVVAALGHSEGVRRGDIDATIDTVVEVTRHVLATTATTIVGFLPLVLSGGGFWPPLAVSIGTGVAGATLISLTLVPSIFRIMGNRATKSEKNAVPA
ncbi:MAG: efflux RND transporter permease subunit [Aureliella sp.]